MPAAGGVGEGAADARTGDRREGARAERVPGRGTGQETLLPVGAGSARGTQAGAARRIPPGVKSTVPLGYRKFV